VPTDQRRSGYPQGISLQHRFCRGIPGGCPGIGFRWARPTLRL